MKLLRLHVENFGTLHDFHMELSGGLNVLHEENGWGKTTLAVFIKAMLYGLPASRATKTDENERKKYTPWQGGAYGGSLELSCAAGEFRIERFFGAKESEDSFVLYDLHTNLESRVFDSNVGLALFGINADSFERSVYLSQRTLGKSDHSNIVERLSSSLDAVDDMGSYDGAMAALEKRRQFYFLRGGKGRVAELEEALARAHRSLEDLKRVRDTLEAKEREAARGTEEMASLTKELRDVRAALLRAGHVEQKTRMLNELRDLNEKKKELEGLLHGHHPTEAALTEQRELLGQLQVEKARLNAIPSTPILPEHTVLLTPDAYNSSPKGEMLPKLERASGEWSTLCQEEALLRASMGGSRRFERGAPTDDELLAARRALESAQRNEADAPAKVRRARGWAWALRIAAVCCIAAGFLWLPVLIGGIVLLLASVVEFSVSCVRASRFSKEKEARAAQEAARRQSAMQSVRALLHRYGVQDSDPARGLDELSYLVRAYRREQEAAREGHARLTEIAERKKQVLSFLRTGFRLYGVELKEKNDYRDEMEALRQDLACFARAEKAERDRRRERVEAETRLRELRERMRPFLERYDPERKHTASELLRLVESRERDYRHILADEATKTAALTAFMREKSMNGEEVLADERTLRDREDRLQSTLNMHQRTQSALLNEIERLSDDADRIPEMEARVLSLTEELAEATVHKKTVDLTKDYLEQAKLALSTRYLDDMTESFSHFLALLTEGAAPESVMSPSFDVSLRTGGKTHEIGYFSRGWRDAVQFCVRLSLAEALCRDGERPFLLLDDPFVNLDDDRLTAAKRLLERLSEHYQIIHMVCHAERG